MRVARQVSFTAFCVVPMDGPAVATHSSSFVNKIFLIIGRVGTLKNANLIFLGLALIPKEQQVLIDLVYLITPACMESHLLELLVIDNEGVVEEEAVLAKGHEVVDEGLRVDFRQPLPSQLEVPVVRHKVLDEALVDQ
jgi:hypothetical protein